MVQSKERESEFHLNVIKYRLIQNAAIVPAA